MLSGKPHDFTVDFYTLGCLIYEMTTGFPPFYSKDRARMNRSIMNNPPTFSSIISPECQDLISWLIEKNPLDRPQSFDMLRRHKWFRGVKWQRLMDRTAIPPWVPSLDKCHYNPRFTSLAIDGSQVSATASEVQSVVY